MHPPHDSCLLSTFSSLLPFRHECFLHLFSFDLRVCKTLNSHHPPRLLEIRVCQTLNPISRFCRTDRSMFRQQLHSVDVQGCQALDFPSCSNMPPSTYSRVRSSRSLPAPLLTREGGPGNRGTKHLRLLIPKGISSVKENERATLQAWLELVD